MAFFLILDCLRQSRKVFSSCHQCILFATACEAGCGPHSLWQSHDRGFCRKFSFAAICGMISLHDQPCIMGERDDGNQF